MMYIPENKPVIILYDENYKVLGCMIKDKVNTRTGKIIYDSVEQIMDEHKIIYEDIIVELLLKNTSQF